ncbi:MAG: serine kinase [Alphaproteobacteria bacterium]|nr:serine kinase [Alphaproteobacteria bacterium]
MSAVAQETLHASSVAVSGKAVLILGPSGSGKSGLALDLISRGAELVSDDRTRIALQGGKPVGFAPDSIRGKIEARGIGILRGPAVGPVAVALVVDLGKPEANRLPAPRTMTILGTEIDLLHGAEVPNLAAAILFFLKGGRLV